MFNKAAAVLFHASPLVPFFMGYKYTGMAVILLVVLAYVKAQKLAAVLSEKQKAGTGTEAEIASIKKTMEFWKNLTFLPDA